MGKLGEELVQAREEAATFAAGMASPRGDRAQVPKAVDVRAIRRKLGLTQKVFAQRFGLSVQSIRSWEQGTRQPEGPARAYLLVIGRAPDAVLRALTAA